jgi:signal transduction histidine kinase
MQIVKTNAERLSVLVNDLLEVSRIDTGRISLTVQSVGLRMLAEDAAADIMRRARIENKALNIQIEFPDDLPKAYGDPERIRQVIYNLISNGYNYTTLNGSIVVRAHCEGSEIQVDVQDNGIGILPKDHCRIFERFYRGDDPLVLATAGSGLGLAMTKNLVEMHKGRIWFESTGVAGKGSVFSFTLPVAQTED